MMVIRQWILLDFCFAWDRCHSCASRKISEKKKLCASCTRNHKDTMIQTVNNVSTHIATSKISQETHFIFYLPTYSILSFPLFGSLSLSLSLLVARSHSAIRWLVCLFCIACDFIFHRAFIQFPLQRFIRINRIYRRT